MRHTIESGGRVHGVGVVMGTDNMPALVWVAPPVEGATEGRATHTVSPDLAVTCMAAVVNFADRQLWEKRPPTAATQYAVKDERPRDERQEPLTLSQIVTGVASAMNGDVTVHEQS